MGSKLTCKQNKKKFQKTGFQSQLFLNFFVVILANSYFLNAIITTSKIA